MPLSSLLKSLPASALRAGCGIRIKGDVAFADSCKHRLQRVIVFLRNGVKLMLMASRAVRCRAYERGHRLSDHVIAVKVFKSIDGCRGGTMVVCSGTEESQGWNQLRFVGKEGVRRQLFANESIPRLVLVKTVDDIVSKFPRVRTQRVVFKSVSVRKVDSIKPMPSPPFSIPRRLQHSVNQMFVGAHCGIVHERLNVFDRRVQSMQINR